MSHPLFDMAGIAQQVQHMQQFAAAAAVSGAVKVDEGAGRPLINALDKGFTTSRSCSGMRAV